MEKWHLSPSEKGERERKNCRFSAQSLCAKGGGRELKGGERKFDIAPVRKKSGLRNTPLVVDRRSTGLRRERSGKRRGGHSEASGSLKAGQPVLVLTASLPGEKGKIKD